MSFIYHPRPATAVELRAKIADCDAVLARAAANMPPKGSLQDMCLGMTGGQRDRAAAELQTLEALDRITIAAGRRGPPAAPADPVPEVFSVVIDETFSVVVETIQHPNLDQADSYYVAASGLLIEAAMEKFGKTARELEESISDCDCEPDPVDGEIRCRCSVYPDQNVFICTDVEARELVAGRGLGGAS